MFQNMKTKLKIILKVLKIVFKLLKLHKILYICAKCHEYITSDSIFNQVESILLPPSVKLRSIKKAEKKACVKNSVMGVSSVNG